MHSYLLLLIPFPLFSSAQTTIVATVIVTAQSSSATSSSQYTSDDDFQSSILNSTNVFRDEHNATALSWNNSLAAYAADYAGNCHWQHSGGPNGENLAQGYDNVTDAVDVWGDERNEYDFNDPGFSEATGHFTQLVWKATTTVGCGRTLCNGTNDVAGWYVVCEYYPPGNVIGEFGTEVQGEVDGAEQCLQGAYAFILDYLDDFAIAKIDADLQYFKYLLVVAMRYIQTLLLHKGRSTSPDFEAEQR